MGTSGIPGSRDPGIPEVPIPNPGIEKPAPGLQSLIMKSKSN